jgi:hypothetical protein
VVFQIVPLGVEKSGKGVLSLLIGTGLDDSPFQGQPVVSKGVRWHTGLGCYKKYM